MKPCVLIPTYDNPRTLAEVVLQAKSHCPDVIVVDDGSREPAGEILRDVKGITVLRHERNLGKGAALATGFRKAEEMGFTHAITLDADGQHLPEEIPLFLEAIQRNPGALFLGSRDLSGAGAGLGSRLGRSNSNFWTFLETGRWLADTQTGFRAYPLESMSLLRLTTTGYDFEIEALVKAAWTGVAVESIPIRARYFRGEERVSHFRPFLDFLRIGRLNSRLVFLRICLPAPYLCLLSLRRFHEKPWWAKIRESLVELFVREPGTPRRIAASVGLGLFMGIAPVWGFQIALTILLAHILGLSKPIAVLASHISFPLMIPFILYASLVLGRLALGLGEETRSIATLRLAPADIPAWIIGSLILALIASVTGAALSYLFLMGARRIRRGKIPT